MLKKIQALRGGETGVPPLAEVHGEAGTKLGACVPHNVRTDKIWENGRMIAAAARAAGLVREASSSGELERGPARGWI